MKGTTNRTKPGELSRHLVSLLVVERHRQGITVKQMLEKMPPGYRDSTIYNIENGHQAPSVELLGHWAGALGLSVKLVPTS